VGLTSAYCGLKRGESERKAGAYKEIYFHQEESRAERLNIRDTDVVVLWLVGGSVRVRASSVKDRWKSRAGRNISQEGYLNHHSDLTATCAQSRSRTHTRQS